MQAVRFADRDIFTESEALISEMMPGFVGGSTGHIIVEAPAAAWTTHEVAQLIVLGGPLANDAAGLAMGLPGLDVDLRRGVERSDNDIADLRRTLGMIVFTSASEADYPERVRQCCIL
ncbi:hypothetical protein QU42_19615 [Bradyrhizobium sp. UASWS1016]|nr:hypothetical protein [Rhizobium sp.]OCX29140.1 hypothetical protein QU42_19615 [Bradyrhizobium sp. UASWS1016]